MDIAELKKIIEGNNTAFGSKIALKLLKKNKVNTIILSNDCNPCIFDEIRRISPEVSVIRLDKSKDELSEVCKKPFEISVISVVTEKTKKQKSSDKGEGEKSK